MRSLSWHLTLFLTCLSSALAVPTCGLVPPTLSSSRPNGTYNPSEDVVIAAWYPSWIQAASPSNIPWSKYTAMTYAFALTTQDPSTLQLDDPARLNDFVQQAKQNRVKALVSVGGWTGSRYFSSAVASPASRATFVKTIVDFAVKYKLDGIDFDWEYPNKFGLECNQKSSQDSTNYLAFLQQLRADPVGKNLILTAAVGIDPFMDDGGQPMSDVSAFAKQFDYISIMAYDIYGPWSPTVGSNAPLDDSCAATQVGSARSAVKAWTGAHFPAEQIALGIAAYGHAYLVNGPSALDANGQLITTGTFDPKQTPKGDKWDSTPGPDPCGTVIDRNGGIFNFVGLIEGKFLNADGSVASGIKYKFDECSQTPYVYNPSSGVMVSYDNADSLAAKGRFVNANNLRGVTMWHVSGDSNGILIDSIHKSMNIESCS